MRFGRKKIDRDRTKTCFRADFMIESYLDYQVRTHSYDIFRMVLLRNRILLSSLKEPCARSVQINALKLPLILA